MTCKILILGASYGSLLGTKLLMAGVPVIERVDKLVQMIGNSLDMDNTEIDEIVATVELALTRNQLQIA